MKERSNWPPPETTFKKPSLIRGKLISRVVMTNMVIIVSPKSFQHSFLTLGGKFIQGKFIFFSKLNGTFLSSKSTPSKICSLGFSEIVADGTHQNCAKIRVLCAVFFLIVLMLEPGIHCFQWNKHIDNLFSATSTRWGKRKSWFHKWKSDVSESCV